MAKIGTAHIEIKPVLNKEALAEIARQIEEAVRAAVQRAMPVPAMPATIPNVYPGTTWTGTKYTTCPTCHLVVDGNHTCTVC